MPAAPAKLTATPYEANAVRLEWEDRADNETGYRVELSYGWGNIWLVVADLPANTTNYVVDNLIQGYEVYARVGAVRADQASGYSNQAFSQPADGDGSMLLNTGFEAAEGSTIGAGLDQGEAWATDPRGFTSPAHGVVNNVFDALGRSGQGQQAYLGGSWRGEQNFSSVYRFDIYDPVPNSTLEFTTLVSFSNSTNGIEDGFGFDLFNQDGVSIVQILFDNDARDIYYAGSTDSNYVDSSRNFSRNRIYTLRVSLDFELNQWSAYLDAMTIATGRPIFTGSSKQLMNFGGVSPFWYVLGSRAGNNRMYFDDMKLTQVGKTVPSMPAAFTAEASSDSIIFLQWEDQVLAERYELQRKTGAFGWTTIATIAEDRPFHIDSGRMPNTLYEYRLRAQNNAGWSAYSAPASAQTYSEYEAWKAQNRFDILTPDSDDSDGDGLPLMLEYALVLSPRRDSLEQIPRVTHAEGKLRLRYYAGRSDLNYSVQTSTDMVNWTTAGVTQMAEILGLYITAEVEAPAGSEQRFLRLIVSDK